MSEISETDRNEAIQAVVDRVSSYQDGAPHGTVASELRKALEEAELTLAAEEVNDLVEAIEADDGPVSAAEVLAG